MTSSVEGIIARWECVVKYTCQKNNETWPEGDVFFSQILCRGVTCRTGRDGIPQSFASQMPAPFSKGAFGAKTNRPAPKSPPCQRGEGRRTSSGGGGIPSLQKPNALIPHRILQIQTIWRQSHELLRNSSKCHQIGGNPVSGDIIYRYRPRISRLSIRRSTAARRSSRCDHSSGSSGRYQFRRYGLSGRRHSPS